MIQEGLDVERAKGPINRAAPLPDAAGNRPAFQCRDYRSGLTLIRTESDIAGIASLLGAASVAGLSNEEVGLLQSATEPCDEVVRLVAEAIRFGADPLGDAFCSLRSAVERRESGAVYTPQGLIDGMLSWAQVRDVPERVVDPGAGSGRFLVESGRRLPNAHLLAIESDPLAALIARANIAAAGMADRSEVRVENFLKSDVGDFGGKTLFVGNPPYVRHHRLPREWKDWLKVQSRALGVRASGLAGLHAYFLLAIALVGKPGDFGVLITSAEWLDVNYGKLIRDLFVQRLGGLGVHLIEPEAEPFPGTATTGAITTFSIGSKQSSATFSRGKSVPSGDDLSTGIRVDRGALVSHSRWSDFTRKLTVPPKGLVELGEICRVHRGQVTGANRVWIEGSHSTGLPDEVMFPSVTKARELLGCGATLADLRPLRRVIDLPADLSLLGDEVLKRVKEFLARAEQMGAKRSYIARHRPAWWSVRLREPAPILATYMARRPPAFVLNQAGARHLNIAHGLYPRGALREPVISNLVAWLRKQSSVQGGRVYAGGLTKFEPREMERILVPSPSMLERIDS